MTIAAILTMGLLGACGSTSHPNFASRADASLSSHPTTDHGRTQAPSLPVPTPPNECDGALDYAAVLGLVQRGFALVAVTATVAAEPRSDGDYDRLVPVAEVSVVAGSSSLGPVDAIHETVASTDNLLPAGTYLLLLGAFQGQPSPYYLADGLMGSFELRDGIAYQRCPNYDDPSKPITFAEGLPVHTLAANLDTAIQEAQNGPIPTAPSQSSSGTTTATP